MTFGDAAQGEKESLPGSVRPQGSQRIGGAGRMKAATATSAKSMKHGRKKHPVEMDGDAEQKGHRTACQESAKIERRAPRRNHSDRRSPKVAVAAAGFAVVTIHSPGFREGNSCRKISFSRRLTELRTTADPTLRETTAAPTVGPA